MIQVGDDYLRVNVSRSELSVWGVNSVSLCEVTECKQSVSWVSSKCVLGVNCVLSVS